VRIVVDLDGVICSIKRPDESYADVAPLPGAAERIRELRAAGHEIVIVTARHMRTTGANIGAVMKRVGKTTLDWLEKHGIEYDELHFGKPNADVYIDDRAIRFTGWRAITDEELADKARLR
jgi:capsule biosynthesis phosphatase